MSVIYRDTVMIDLTQKGATVYVDVDEATAATFVGLDANGWGSAVVEIKKDYGGYAAAYSTAKVVSAANRAVEDLDVSDGVLSVALEVTTADASAGQGRISVRASSAASSSLSGGEP